MFECTYSLTNVSRANCSHHQSTHNINEHNEHNIFTVTNQNEKFESVHRSKKVKAVDLVFLICSSLTLIFPCWVKVANLFCHIPSITNIASSSPGLTQSIIWRPRLLYPHLAKCLPSGVLSSSISRLCPVWRLCIGSVVLPNYWADHARHVTKLIVHWL